MAEIDASDGWVGPPSLDDLTRFLKNAGLRECEVCGTDNWGLVEAPDKRVPHMGAYHRGSTGSISPSSGYFLAVAIATCSTCGNMKFFSEHVIQTWLASTRLQPEATKDDA